VYKENMQRSEIEHLNLLVKDDNSSEQKKRNIARTMVLLRISAILAVIILVKTSSSVKSQSTAPEFRRSTCVYS
jgi:hypothetical protein